MKKTRVLLVSFIMIMMVFLLSGCKFIDVQKEQQEAKEDTIQYLNTKYKKESSFKKYERKDLKKALDNNSGISTFVCSTCCSIEPFCKFTYSASDSFQMKDGTIVMKDNNGNYTDNRQADKIKEDFREYFYDKFFGRYNYTDENITYLSKYKKIESIKTKYNNDGQFSKYYDGKNMDEIAYDKPLYAEGDVHIWIQSTDFESTCKEIETSLRNSIIYYKGTVYIYDVSMKNSKSSDDEKKIGTLEIDSYKGKYERNYRDIYKY